MYRFIIRENDNRVDNLLNILLINGLVEIIEEKERKNNKYKWIGPIRGSIVIEEGPVSYLGIYDSLVIK
jgi:hypothetical protein